MPQFRLNKPHYKKINVTTSVDSRDMTFDLVARAYTDKFNVEVTAKIADADRELLKKLWDQPGWEPWERARNQVLAKYRPQVVELEKQAHKKAQDWLAGHQFMDRIETIVTGVVPARLVKHLTGFKYVWVQGDMDPSEAAETLGALVNQREPAEQLIRLNHRTENQYGDNSSIYVLVTPEQRLLLNRKLIELNRAKVAKKL
jgi:hypothetical protein